MPYPILRVGPDETYHGNVLCATDVLARFGTLQPGSVALLGWPVESQASWLTYPPRRVALWTIPVRRKRGRSFFLNDRLRALWCHVRHSWSRPALRSLLLDVPWELSGRRGSPILLAWPWVLRLWQALTVGWPEPRRQPLWAGGSWVLGHGQQVLVVGYLGLALVHAWSGAGGGRSGMPTSGAVLGMSGLVYEREGLSKTSREHDLAWFAALALRAAP